LRQLDPPFLFNNAIMSEARVYVGNLPGDVRKDELEKLFDKYGA
jgi:RNA recognition motif-containing protein